MKLFIFFIFSIVLSTSQVFAQRKYNVMGHFDILSTWIPYKKGLSVGMNPTKDWIFDLGYEWASISVPSGLGVDIGKISERRISLLGRRFVGTSFHFIMGLFYEKFEAKVGDDIIDELVLQNQNTTLQAMHMGPTLGIGNRWLWDNGLTLQMEWIKVNIPMFNKKTKEDLLNNMGDEDDKEDAHDFLHKLNSFPTFTLLGFGLGYSF